MPLLQKAIEIIIHHFKDAMIVVLGLLLLLLNWELRVERGRIAHSPAAELPENVSKTITIYRDRVVTKWRSAPMKIIYRDRYLPPEGSVMVSLPAVGPQNEPQIVVMDHGFTHRLGGGMLYSEKFLPEADLKWFYFRRYSALGGVTPEFIGAGLSRHIDDFTPFDSVELAGLAGISWQGKLRFGIGLRTNF